MFRVGQTVTIATKEEQWKRCNTAKLTTYSGRPVVVTETRMRTGDGASLVRIDRYETGRTDWFLESRFNPFCVTEEFE